MATPTIVTRAGKGSALTHVEADANFTNLQNATISVTDGSNSTAIDLNGSITFSGTGGITVTEGSGTITVDGSSASGGLANIVEDTSPQLGGNLDIQSNSIVTTTTDGSIVLTPNGTGLVEIQGDAQLNNQLVIVDTEELGFGVITGGTATGLAFATNNADENSEAIYIVPTGGIQLIGAGNGVSIDDQIFPSADGTANQVLKTDGAGNLSWVTITQATGSELANIVEDTTPQLGGNLDINGNSIVSVSNGSINITPDGTGEIALNGGVNVGQFNYYNEKIHLSSTTTGTWTPDPADGPIQYVAMTGSMTINDMGGDFVAGDSITILFDGTGGSYTLTLGSKVLKAGGDATLTDGGFDVLAITCVDDEASAEIYLASLATNFS